MPWLLVWLRFLALTMLAVWLGGFTFYSAVVIPALHDALGRVEAGFFTQDVTDRLNALGVVCVLTWWLLIRFDRSAAPRWTDRTRSGALIATTILLAVLIVLHRVMDERLATSGLRGFYPLHRVYLITSTAQWVANLGLLLTVAARR